MTNSQNLFVSHILNPCWYKILYLVLLYVFIELYIYFLLKMNNFVFLSDKGNLSIYIIFKKYLLFIVIQF